MAALISNDEATGGAAPLNFARLEENLGKEAAVEVLNAFIGYARDAVAELKQCLQRQNAGQACALVRELKSSCAIVGAARLLSCLHRLESAFAAHDREKIEVCVDDVQRETISLRHMSMRS